MRTPDDPSMAPDAVPQQKGLAVLCWALGGLTLAAPALGALLDSPGGMIRHIGLALGILVALGLNLASFAVNFLYARRRRWSPRWLGALVAVQGAIAGVTLVAGGWSLVQPHLDPRRGAYEQQLTIANAIDSAIRANDAEALKRGLDRCGAGCADRLDQYLLTATRIAAHRPMELLLALGANPAPDEPQTSIQTCEGPLLWSVNSLDIAIARGDAQAIALLLPKADARAREGAAWMAARRDRLELLQSLTGAGVPITTRGGTRHEPLTLLNAAAAGAALRVGAWLLTQHGLDANGAPTPDSETPLASLVGFAVYADNSPRIRPFLALLLAHGADLERVSPKSGRTALQEAIHAPAVAMVDALLDAGASQRVLTAQDRARLEALRRDPPRHRVQNRPDCMP